MSGGGTIYTDMDSWQLSFIAKMNMNEIVFAQFIMPVAEAAPCVGLNASLNNLAVDCKKFSGDAQFFKEWIYSISQKGCRATVMRYDNI